MQELSCEFRVQERPAHVVEVERVLHKEIEHKCPNHTIFCVGHVYGGFGLFCLNLFVDFCQPCHEKLQVLLFLLADIVHTHLFEEFQTQCRSVQRNRVDHSIITVGVDYKLLLRRGTQCRELLTLFQSAFTGNKNVLRLALTGSQERRRVHYEEIHKGKLLNYAQTLSLAQQTDVQGQK